MNRGKTVIGTAVFLALAAGCGNQAALNSQQLKPVTLAYRYTAGTQRTYDFQLATDAKVAEGAAGSQPLKETMAATMVYKVLSVDSAGTATVQITMSAHSMQINGRQLGAAMKPQTFTLKIAKDGTTVSGSGFSISGGAPGSIPGTDQLTSLLPHHAVKPGDSWDTGVDRPMPFGGGSIKFTSHNKFLKWATLAGHQDAVIETKGTLPLNVSIDLAKIAAAYGSAGAMSKVAGLLTEVGTVTVDTTSWLEQSTGQLDKSTNHMTMDVKVSYPAGFAGIPAGASSTVRGTFTMGLTAA